MLAQFQSTLPVWGATLSGGACVDVAQNFNPRSPCGERLCRSISDAMYSSVFQSTLPVWGATNEPIFIRQEVEFQSTLPVWGATLGKSHIYFHNLFQSTLPVWGATYLLLIIIGVGADFNPRSPCGERHGEKVRTKK